MNHPTKVTVALVQMSCCEDRQINLQKALQRISEAAEQNVDIVCLQELFSSLYPCQSENYGRFQEAESIPGPTSEALRTAAAEHELVVVGSLFERRTEGIYHNTALIYDTTGRCELYRKMHVPDDPFYQEKFYFTPGDIGFHCHKTNKARLGVGVCWDQWFPEAARILALRGAQILVYPTAIGWLREEKEEWGSGQWSAWETMLRSHAIANGLFVVAPNRVGSEGNIQFWGASTVVDPNGCVLCRGTHDMEETLIVELNLAQIDVVRTHWPFLRDRRIDAYGDLLKRFVDSDE